MILFYDKPDHDELTNYLCIIKLNNRNIHCIIVMISPRKSIIERRLTLRKESQICMCQTKYL